jgi:hypothetical protein
MHEGAATLIHILLLQIMAVTNLLVANWKLFPLQSFNSRQTQPIILVIQSLSHNFSMVRAGHTNGGSIIVPMTSCSTALESAL